MADHQSHTVGRVCIHAEGGGTYRSSPADGFHARCVEKHLKLEWPLLGKTYDDDDDWLHLWVCTIRCTICLLFLAGLCKKKHQKWVDFNKTRWYGGGRAKKWPIKRWWRSRNFYFKGTVGLLLRYATLGVLLNGILLSFKLFQRGATWRVWLLLWGGDRLIFGTNLHLLCE